MTRNEKNTKISDMTYEEAIKRLEEIVNRLESAEIPLEESLSSFQEGIALSRYCREKLAEIEYKVEYLLKEEQQQGLDTCENSAADIDRNGDDQ